MPKMRLTEKGVDRLPFSDSGNVEYWDTRLPGFFVRVGLRSKTFCVYSRVKNIQVKKNVGRVGVWTFDDAYIEAERILKDAARGISVADRKNEQELLALSRSAETLTMREIFTSYCSARKKLKENTKSHYLAKLECYVSEWIDRPMVIVTPDMVLKKHSDIGVKSKAQADHVFRVIRALFNHAMELHDNVFTRNPVRRLSAVSGWYHVPRKQTYLAPSSLTEFFECVEAHPGVVSDYLLTLLFTGVRSASEVAKLETGHVDFKERTLSLFDTKTKVYDVMPMCKTVASVLKRRAEDARAKGVNYLFYAFMPQPARSGVYTPKMPHQPLKDIRGSIETIFSGSTIGHITPHDFRRSFLTYADELGIGNVVQKRLVGHAISQDVTDGYKFLSMDRLRKETSKVERYILAQAKLKNR